MDSNGFKGRNVTKGSLGGFLKAVERGIIDKGSVLLVESLDRLSRDQITEQMTMFMNIINAGISIVTLGDNMSYSKDTINNNLTGFDVTSLFGARRSDSLGS